MDKVLWWSWALMVGQVATTMILFLLLVKINAEDKKQNKVAKDKKEPQISVLENQINSLQEELKKAKTGYRAVQNELQELKNIKSNLEKELNRQKESYDLTQREFYRLKKEESELRDKLANKERESEKMRSQSLTIEGELRGKNQELRVLQDENKEIATKLKDLETHLDRLENEAKTQRNIIAEDKGKEKEKEGKPVFSEGALKRQEQLELSRQQKKGRMGEILLAQHFITEDILDRALEFQKNTGNNITQYLLAYGYIDEAQLAQCLCTQFGIPYLPLCAYSIPDEIIKLVPVDVAEKYWLIPVEKLGNFLMVAMADPFDTKAIKEVEEISGFKVRPLVGILSEIIESLELYYKVAPREKGAISRSITPFFIDTKTYKGPERRQAVRFKAKIDIYFPVEGYYKKSQTKDVSRDGLLFESDTVLPIGSLITLQIDLPKDLNPLPIGAIVQVLRVTSLADNKFGIGVKIMKISKQELNTIIEYASSQEGG